MPFAVGHCKLVGSGAVAELNEEVVDMLVKLDEAMAAVPVEGDIVMLDNLELDKLVGEDVRSLDKLGNIEEAVLALDELSEEDVPALDELDEETDPASFRAALWKPSHKKKPVDIFG